MNRAEYNNTVRDLFLTAQKPADSFPEDDFGYGFSSIAQVLSLSATHLDLYQTAAAALVDEISLDRTIPEIAIRMELEHADGAGVVWGTARNLWTEGTVELDLAVADAGDWRIQLLASGENAAEARLTLDGAELGTWVVDLQGGPPAVTVPLTTGTHHLTVELVNPGDEADLDHRPLLALDALTASGPVGVPVGPGPGRAHIFTCDPLEIGEAPCVEEIARGFVRRAWRRPVHQDELDRLLGVYSTARGAGADWEEATQAVIEAALVAPQFVFRMEIDGVPDMQLARALDGWELASRLSYFLWSSTPDDRLLDLADSGALTDPAVLEGEVVRMLHDPKAAALVETLGVEWLYLGAIESSAPDTFVFPDFDEGLRASMRSELRLFTSDILLGDRSMRELVNGTRTRIDPVLAAHYGVPSPSAAGFAEATIPDRLGIMGRAGWLTSVSYSKRTSPVQRGKWVLDNLMCEAPPPPPPDVGALPADEPGSENVTQSVRQQLEEHRANPACAGCHEPMDGIGFALENFDAVGQWREIDEYDLPIDASGELPGGITFGGPIELADTLAADPRLPRCMTQKVFTFALGRAPRVEDLDVLADLERQFTASDMRFSALATAIVLSDPFRYRVPAGEAP